MIIGVTGKARAGKDTVANYLVDTYGFKRIGFADAVKEMALILNPIIDTGIIDYDDCEVEEIRLADHVKDYGWENAKDTIPEVRAFLQRLGTDAVRNIVGPNAWVDIVSRRIREDGATMDWVIPDVRFLNEAKEVKYIGGYVVRVNRHITPSKAPASAHLSETEMDQIEPDSTIWNTDTIESLHDEIDSVMINLINHRR